MSEKNVNSDMLRLKDMLQAIADIEEIALKTQSPRRDMLATAYAVAVLGEAAGRIAPVIKEKYPAVPWRAITGMRHKIIHEYGKIDMSILLRVIADDIPALKRQLTDILSTLNP